MMELVFENDIKPKNLKKYEQGPLLFLKDLDSERKKGKKYFRCVYLETGLIKDLLINVQEEKKLIYPKEDDIDIYKIEREYIKLKKKGISIEEIVTILNSDENIEKTPCKVLKKVRRNKQHSY